MWLDSDTMTSTVEEQILNFHLTAYIHISLLFLTPQTAHVIQFV